MRGIAALLLSLFLVPTGPGWVEQARQARARVYARDGVVAVFERAYRAKFDRGTARLGSFEYRFASARAGADLLAASGDVPAELDGSRVVFRRGRLDETYELLHAGVEQSFAIAEPLRDDLEIRGRVRAERTPRDGARGASLAFGDVVVDGCRAVDAAGRSLDLELAFDAGELAIRVPGAWLTSAAYPVVVDPLIGDRLTVRSGIADMVRSIDVTYNAVENHYFVVWSESFGDSDYDLWSARIDAATGALVPGMPGLPNPNPLDFDSESTGEVATAWNATLNQYLTVYAWTRVTGPQPGSWDVVNIKGRVTNGDGTNAPGPDGSTPSNAGFFIDGTTVDGAPDVVAFDDRWRVVWNHLTPLRYIGTIMGRDVTGADAFAGDAFVVRPGDSSVSATSPAIAYSASTQTFLTAWIERAPLSSNVDAECAVRTLTSAYPPTFGPMATVSGGGPGAPDRPRAAACSAGEFVCVWAEFPDPDASRDSDVRARRVDASGTPAGSEVVIETDSEALVVQGGPDVAYGAPSDAYLVTWHRVTYVPVMGYPVLSGGEVRWGVYRAATLAPLNAPVDATGDVDIQYWPACTTKPGGVDSLVVWIRAQATDSGPFTIEAQLALAAAAPDAPALLVQSDEPGGPSKPAGFTDRDGLVAMRATLPHPLPEATVRLQVEVKPIGAAFDGAGLVTGNAVPAGGVSEAVAGGLPNGTYRWRARGIDDQNHPGPWLPFASPSFLVGVPKENANGDLGINDTYCGGSVPAGGGGLLGGLIAVLLAAALLRGALRG